MPDMLQVLFFTSKIIANPSNRMETAGLFGVQNGQIWVIALIPKVLDLCNIIHFRKY